jgi:hypothetical protein
MRYLGDCVSLGADFVWDLRKAGDKSRVTYATFRRCVGSLGAWAKKRGYDARAPGVTLRADPIVTYHKGTIRGHVCYWLIWSGYEHVWGPYELGDVSAWWA